MRKIKKHPELRVQPKFRDDVKKKGGAKRRHLSQCRYCRNSGHDSLAKKTLNPLCSYFQGGTSIIYVEQEWAAISPTLLLHKLQRLVIPQLCFSCLQMGISPLPSTGTWGICEKRKGEGLQVKELRVGLGVAGTGKGERLWGVLSYFSAQEPTKAS